MNVADMIMIVILCFAVFGALRIIYRNKKAGKTCCGGDCARCMRMCHGKSCGREPET